MSTSAIDSLIFRDIFGSPAMREVWSDTYRTKKYLEWEAALARAEAAVGLIPPEAADEISSVCKVENVDFEAYARRRLPSAIQCLASSTRLPISVEGMPANTAIGEPPPRTSRTPPPSCRSRPLLT